MRNNEAHSSSNPVFIEQAGLNLSSFLYSKAPAYMKSLCSKLCLPLRAGVPAINNNHVLNVLVSNSMYKTFPNCKLAKLTSVRKRKSNKACRLYSTGRVELIMKSRGIPGPVKHSPCVSIAPPPPGPAVPRFIMDESTRFPPKKINLVKLERNSFTQLSKNAETGEFVLDLVLGQSSVDFLIDTGSPFTLLSENTFSRCFPSGDTFRILYRGK